MDPFTSKKKDPVIGDRTRLASTPSTFFATDWRWAPDFSRRHPQSNGMVESFHGRIGEIVERPRFGFAAELESALRNYLNIYSHSIRQQALDQQTPMHALTKWHDEKPELPSKHVYNQALLDP